jgi:hypothetical protein
MIKLINVPKPMIRQTIIIRIRMNGRCLIDSDMRTSSLRNVLNRNIGPELDVDEFIDISIQVIVFNVQKKVHYLPNLYQGCIFSSLDVVDVSFIFD